MAIESAELGVEQVEGTSLVEDLESVRLKLRLNSLFAGLGLGIEPVIDEASVTQDEVAIPVDVEQSLTIVEFPPEEVTKPARVILTPIPVVNKSTHQATNKVATTSPKPARRPQTSDHTVGFGIANMPQRRSRTERANQDPDFIRLYLDDIGRHALLTKDDEARLSKRVQAGLAARELIGEFLHGDPELIVELEHAVLDGEKAKKDFVNANLRLVVSIAKKYQGSGISLLDLIQEGNLGLMHAVDKFDWRKGFKFSTYATWWIRQSIQRGVINTGEIIRKPVHMHDQIREFKKQKAELQKELGSGVSDEQVAKRMEIGPDELRILQEAINQEYIFSLDATIDPNAPKSMEKVDTIADPESASKYDEIENSIDIQQLRQTLIEWLGEREAEVLMLHFNLERADEPLTLGEIGEKFDLAGERIRQIKRDALLALSHPSAHKILKSVLPIDSDDEWQQDAACLGTLPDIIFKIKGALPVGRPAEASFKAHQEIVDELKQICEGCPVRDRCEEFANDNKPPRGLWSGKVWITTSRGKRLAL